MSVLLTAGRRINKPKSAKPKKKKRPARQNNIEFNPIPPFSSEKTLVWYWQLDGVNTTVMFTKEKTEVWCNGMVLDTIDGFADDAEGDGGVIDFCIYIEESDLTHKARIKRTLSGERRDFFNHQLFVDGFCIMEHTKESYEAALAAGAYEPLDIQDPPPPYEEEELGACALVPNGEAKKDV